MKEFPQATIEALEFYVYRLEDPADGATFYVGKGQSNRAFDHARAAIKTPVKNDKLDRIRAILAGGDEPNIVIHRHGMTEETALHVEAALIDAFRLGELTNLMGGHFVDMGPATPEEIVERYAAEPAVIDEPTMLIRIEREWRRDLTPDQLYERTRRYWVAAPLSRRPPPKYAMAVARGIIRQVYEIDEWVTYDKAPIEELKKLRDHTKPWPKGKKRVAFEGQVAAKLDRYVGMSVRHILPKGSQNPIRYVNC